MPSVTFFAARDDLLDVIRFAVDDCGCRVIEAYSPFDREPREFERANAVEAVPGLGTAFGPQLALWHAGTGSPPMRRRVELRPGAVPGHTYRYVVEGCGLLTLQCEGVRDDVLVASSLGWWTEAGARARAAPDLGAEQVNWPALGSIGRKLRYHITRRLARGSAGGRPVLAKALELARAGTRLRDPRRPTVGLTVDTL